MNPESQLRIRVRNAAPMREPGDFVLYWMIAFRRTRWNFALQRAIEWARKLDRPLVILEGLRCGYHWASDRLHRFILDGMADNAQRLRDKPVLYYPYVEPAPDAGKGMLEALAARACVVVTDDFPCFMLPNMVVAAARQVNVCLEQVDSNGLLPMRAASQVFPTAFALRRFMQKHLRPHLAELPSADPLARIKLPILRSLGAEFSRRWPAASPALLAGDAKELARLPIDHAVPVAATRGGMVAAEGQLRRFLDERLARYVDERSQPEADVASGLSPYLHFGHVSAHQVFAELARREDWSEDRLAATTSGAKDGWWGMSGPAEAFLDELVTWRELGFNMCWQRADYDRYESLPDWARRTLEKHARDRREHVYSPAQFEQAETHDPLWNAAQRQLVREGRIHNYLRMLWGKKVLEWSPSPRDALEVLIELNNKYALDGRDPNSYSGIFWCLGRYDRPWFPERPIFGQVRYMSSDNTARKFRVRAYVERYGKA